MIAIATVERRQGPSALRPRRSWRIAQRRKRKELKLQRTEDDRYRLSVNVETKRKIEWYKMKLRITRVTAPTRISPIGKMCKITSDR